MYDINKKNKINDDIKALLNCYIDGLKKFATFRGRTTRSEFWCFFICNAFFVLSLIFITFGIIELLKFFINSSWIFIFVGLSLFLYIIFSLIASFAILTRRFHDAGFSGWWVWINFFIFIYGKSYKFIIHNFISNFFLIISIIFSFFTIFVALLVPSKPNPNKYGYNSQFHKQDETAINPVDYNS